MLSLLCFPNFVYKFFSVWAVEKEKNVRSIGLKQFFLNLPVKKEIITNIRKQFEDSELKSGENIWWIL